MSRAKLNPCLHTGPIGRWRGCFASTRERSSVGARRASFRALARRGGAGGFLPAPSARPSSTPSHWKGSSESFAPRSSFAGIFGRSGWTWWANGQPPGDGRRAPETGSGSLFMRKSSAGWFVASQEGRTRFQRPDLRPEARPEPQAASHWSPPAIAMSSARLAALGRAQLHSEAVLVDKSSGFLR
jgi:hypothetical protein